MDYLKKQFSSRPNNSKYRENYDSCFGQKVATVLMCEHCESVAHYNHPIRGRCCTSCFKKCPDCRWEMVNGTVFKHLCESCSAAIGLGDAECERITTKEKLRQLAQITQEMGLYAELGDAE